MQPPPLLPPLLPPVRTSSGWFSRNLKWLLLLLFGLTIAGGTGFFLLLFGVMKRSDAYQGALLRVKNDPEVILALGKPVEEGLLLSGEIHIKNSSGWADLSIPISGPKASATAYVKATKADGAWHFDRLTVKVDGIERLIVLSLEAPPGAQFLEK